MGQNQWFTVIYRGNSIVVIGIGMEINISKKKKKLSGKLTILSYCTFPVIKLVSKWQEFIFFIENLFLEYR